jgi:hypothetical protein
MSDALKAATTLVNAGRNGSEDELISEVDDDSSTALRAATSLVTAGKEDNNDGDDSSATALRAAASLISAGRGGEDTSSSNVLAKVNYSGENWTKSAIDKLKKSNISERGELQKLNTDLKICKCVLLLTNLLFF